MSFRRFLETKKEPTETDSLAERRRGEPVAFHPKSLQEAKILFVHGGAAGLGAVNQLLASRELG